MTDELPHVVVVGGGIAGLAAAHALRGRARVTVLEQSATIGGKLSTAELEGLPVETGAESFLARVPTAVDLAREVGLGDDLVAPATTAARIWARGRLRPLPQRTLLGIPTSVRSLAGVLSRAQQARAALDRMLPGDAPVDDVAVGAWVRQRLGAAVADGLVDPLLGGVYAGRADRLSLHATMPQLPTDERSAIAAARRAVPPPRPDAGPVFLTVRGGLGRLPAAVAAASGAEIVTGCAVRRLEPTPAGWRVIHGATNAERAVEAAGVVVALPPAPAGRLLGDVAAAAAGELGAVDTASMALVTTVWRRADLATPPGSGYLVPASACRPVKAVTFFSAKWAHLDDPALAVVRCSIGRYADVLDLQRDDADLVDLAVTELRAHAGAHGDPVAARVNRWGGGLPQYAVGHLDRVRRIRAAVAAVPGLGVCGATYDGVGIPACIRSGQAAADQVLATRPSPPVAMATG